MSWTAEKEFALRRAIIGRPEASWDEIGVMIGVTGNQARKYANRRGIDKLSSRHVDSGGHYTDRRCNVRDEVGQDHADAWAHREADERFVSLIRERLAT